MDSGAGDVLIARIDAAGAPVWSMAFGGPENETGRSVAVDPAGNVFVSGSYRGAPMLSIAALPQASIGSAFVLKLDPLGTPLYSRGFAVNDESAGAAIAWTPDGRLITAGTYNGSVSFDGRVLEDLGAGDVYVAELLP